MRTAWVVGSVVFLLGCGAAIVDPCLENPSACDAGVDAGLGLDAGAAEPDAGDPADAGDATDAGADAGLRFVDLDYRTTRGLPLATRVLGEARGAAWALTGTRVVLQHGCDGGACDLSWRDDTGLEVASATNLRALNTSVVSRDGRLAALFEAHAAGACADADGFVTDHFTGAWHLLDVASAAKVVTRAPVTTAEYLDTAFLRRGGHARFFPFAPGPCQAVTPALHATAAPWAEPPLLASLPDRAWVEDELHDGSLLLSLFPETLAVARPDDPGSLFRVSDATPSFRSVGAWVHGFERYPVQAVVSVDVADGAARRTPLPVTERDWFEEAASHRFAAVCSFPDAQQRRPCLVVDGAGRVPPTSLRTGPTLTGRRQLALAGQAGFAVYLDADTRRPVRLDLERGLHQPLALPSGLLRVVGDGRGVLLLADEEVVLLGRDEVKAVPGRLSAALSTELAGGPADLPQAQVVFLLTTSASGGEVWLHAWHVASGRVARLSDSVLFNPPFRRHFTEADDCAAPGFLRAAGAPGESAFQRATSLHFTEFVPGAPSRLRVFVMPVDLSSPPRLFAELDPGACAPPLASADGARAWLPVPTSTGRSRLVVAPLD